MAIKMALEITNWLLRLIRIAKVVLRESHEYVDLFHRTKDSLFEIGDILSLIHI